MVICTVKCEGYEILYSEYRFGGEEEEKDGEEAEQKREEEREEV